VARAANGVARGSKNRKRDPKVESIRKEAERLGPWHLNVEITPSLSTGDLKSSDGPGGFYDPGPPFKQIFERVYPGGLEGRSALDCACNNGAYLFALKELGAGHCYGSDVRDLWIEQAKFLARNRKGPSDSIDFEVQDLYELPKLGVGPFDITIFAGVFYHLPDPLNGLKIAAEMTGELLYLSSASLSGFRDRAIVVGSESTEAPLSGVYGLQWYPTGPGVFKELLPWMGFPEVRVLNWWNPETSMPHLDVVQLLAARDKKVFEHFDSTHGGSTAGVFEHVRAEIPPRATVLVVSAGQDGWLNLPERRIWHFPQDATGAHSDTFSDRELLRQLEALRVAGAGYLVVPSSSFPWLESKQELNSYLRLRFDLVLSDPTSCIIFSLD
jgi:SAM-dependent methyltransferase